MASTITFTGDRAVVVAELAAGAGVSEEVYVQAIADREADQALNVKYNDWWNGLTLAEKAAIYVA
jgi:hypothetical protein